MEVEVKWIKLLTRFFDDEKIKLIEAMPDADTIIVIWVKLLTLAGKKNMNGYIFLAENIPYTDEMLSTLFNRPLNTIRLALDIFKKFKMVKFNNDGIAKINNWEKHQNIEGLDKIREQGRLRQIKHRDKFKQLPEKASNVTVTSHNGTEEKRRDKKEIKKEIKTKEIYKEKFLELWNKYPNKDGKTQAYKHFNTSVKTKEDWLAINTALTNYLKSERVNNGYVKNGSTWFNGWRDWIDYVEPNKPQPAKEHIPDYLTHKLGDKI